MRKMISVLGLLMVASFWVPASMGQVQDEVLTNADIVMLTDAGVPAEAIVNKINSARTNFDTSVEQLVALSKAGVDASVMAAMTEQDSHAESDLEADTQPKADTPSETDPAQQTDPPQAARPDPVAPVEEQPAPAPTAVSKPLAPVSPMRWGAGSGERQRVLGCAEIRRLRPRNGSNTRGPVPHGLRNSTGLLSG